MIQSHHLYQGKYICSCSLSESKFYHDKIIKYRTGNHRLPTETGRWGDTPLNERKCNVCNKNNIGDEYHYFFLCDFFKNERKLYLKPYFYVNPNLCKYRELLPQIVKQHSLSYQNLLELLCKRSLHKFLFPKG